MEFRVEKKDECAEVSRVTIVPSHPEGGFVFDHPHYGRRIVGWLGVRSYLADRQALLETGQESIGDYFASVDDSSDLHAVAGIDVVAMLDVPGSRNRVTVEVELFQEVAPV